MQLSVPTPAFAPMPACTRCATPVDGEQHRCPACDARLGFVPELGILCAFEDRGEAGWHPLGAPGLGVRLPCGNYGEHPVCCWTVPADGSDCYCESCRCLARSPQLADPAQRRRWARFGRARRRLFTGLRQLGLLDARGRPLGLAGPVFDVVDAADEGDGGAVRESLAGPVLVDLRSIDDMGDGELFEALRRAMGLRLCLVAGALRPAHAPGEAFDADRAMAQWEACWARLEPGAGALRRWRGSTVAGYRPAAAASRRDTC